MTTKQPNQGQPDEPASEAPPLTAEEQDHLRRLLDILSYFVGWPIVADPVDRLWIPLRPLGVACRGYRLHRTNLPKAARPGAPVGHVVIDLRHVLGWGPSLASYPVPITPDQLKAMAEPTTPPPTVSAPPQPAEGAGGTQLPLLIEQPGAGVAP